jgi:ABC-type xylose transport system permease subunit
MILINYFLQLIIANFIVHFIYYPTIKKKTHRDGSNTVVKGCTTISKKISRAIKATIQKVNQAKYHEVNILFLYLINLIQKQSFLKKRLNLTKYEN